MKLVSTIAMTAVLATTATASMAAECGDFPQRPIEVVVPYGAGGAVDITSRTLAEAAKVVAGWELRVANRTGAGTVTGQDYLATQAPTDGYTIGVMPLMAAVLNDADERNALEPGSLEVLEAIAFDPWLFVALKGQTLDSLIKKGEAGELRYAFSPGSEQGLMGDKFQEKHGFEMARVPLAGGVNRLGGLLNGSVDIAPSFYGESKQYIDSGVMVPIGYTNDVPFGPDESTVALGSEGYDFGHNVWGSYRVVLVPDGVPEDIKSCLADTLTEIMESEQGKEIFLEKTILVEPVGHETAKAKYGEFQKIVNDLLAVKG
ncbi:tripartite tricarboxylate transporter substrate-binding protein [Nitratireductor luteus]|uniref:tripartite tricarboxylate transporter substrate-binding protein n=1 Tax=Nitratireductor luteus TaxID=2976980 RepID=UPI0022400E31|nr:tripartite tricarboxylate transporter substrate-binding protein [Nitratireductor luteus]